MSDLLLTVHDVAERCQVDPKTVRRAINGGKLRVRRLGSGPRSDRIHPSDLDAWLAGGFESHLRHQ